MMNETQRKKRQGLTVILAAFLLSMLLAMTTLAKTQTGASTSSSGKISLNYSEKTILIGSSFWLKASGYIKNAAFRSSNKKVATVSTHGKVVGIKTGTAKITVKNAKGKTATCKVTVTGVKARDKEVVIYNAVSGKKTYHCYRQEDYGGYIHGRGCIIAAVSIVESAYGEHHSPTSLHCASASKKYSERYAVKKLGQSDKYWGNLIITTLTASQMLTDVGINNTPVYKFTNAQAIKDIKNNLKQGRPVIVKANNKRYNGNKIANGHHALVLIGYDDDGYLLFIDPMEGALNYAHGSRTTMKKLTVETLVNYHMSSCSEKIKTAYTLTGSSCWGYILINQ